MSRNSIKIVSNTNSKQISYYYKNEAGAWMPVSRDSELSKPRYTNTSISESAESIIGKMDEIYNSSNRGLDILFEGDRDSFELLKDKIEITFQDRDITCTAGITRIAVIGKRGAGKTYLIEAMELKRKSKYSIHECQGYHIFREEINNAEWYELNVIDSGNGGYEKAYKFFEGLKDEKISKIVYCINSLEGRIGDLEWEFIKKLKDSDHNTSFIVVLANSIKNDVKGFENEIRKRGIDVITVLAKEYETEVENADTGQTESRVIPPYGLDELVRRIF